MKLKQQSVTEIDRRKQRIVSAIGDSFARILDASDSLQATISLAPDSGLPIIEIILPPASLPWATLVLKLKSEIAGRTKERQANDTIDKVTVIEDQAESEKTDGQKNRE